MWGSRRAWRHLFGAVTATALLVGLGPRVAAGTELEDTSQVISLQANQRAFWEGSLTATAPRPVACAAIEGACATYMLEVKDAAWRLRVALDRPSSAGELSLALIDPSGAEHATAEDIRRDEAQSAFGLYSFELFAQRPTTGRWTVRISARSGPPVGPYRMRAKLETEPNQPPAQATPHDLLPNLRPIPPYELTFADAVPWSVDGCRVEEIAEYAPGGPCLRFSTGPTNIGVGPLDLRYAGGMLDGPIKQRIHRSDGTWREVDGGQFHYHLSHGHYHHDSIGAMVLSRVDADGALTTVDEAPKTGYCMYDYLIAEWDRFVQEVARPVEDQFTSCGATNGPTGANLGLTVGWGDVYGYPTIGNFVDFAGQGDGEYVLTMTSDWDGSIVESDETDNTAYTWFRVAGRTVEVLERGIGSGPADPAKILVDDTRPPSIP
jgi:hypothetical protein